MIIPESLHTGDKVAVVSLSSGSIGEEKNINRYEKGKKVLEEKFGLEVIAMPNALKGKQWVKDHPELRAKDLMDAFLDPEIKAIFTLTGGDDTIRLLPYIDFDIIRNNPKIFMGYSDTTANHFMMNKAGIVSYYGPAIAVEFSMPNNFEQNLITFYNTFFAPTEKLKLEHYGILANDPSNWNERILQYENDNKGYEVLQGGGIVKGKALGGCLELFQMINGTKIWPAKEEWRDRILFIETSEENPSPSVLKYTLYNLGAQGILDEINAIMIGRPKNGVNYNEYNETILEVLRQFNKTDLPVITNCHFGHAWLWNIVPMGTEITIDFDKRNIFLSECPTKNRNIENKKI